MEFTILGLLVIIAIITLIFSINNFTVCASKVVLGGGDGCVSVALIGVNTISVVSTDLSERSNGSP